MATADAPHPSALLIAKPLKAHHARTAHLTVSTLPSSGEIGDRSVFRLPQHLWGNPRMVRSL